MDIENIQNQINRIGKSIAILQRKIADESIVENRINNKIQFSNMSMRRSKSANFINGIQNDILKHQNDIFRCKSKIADFQQQIANKTEELGRKKQELLKVEKTQKLEQIELQNNLKIDIEKQKEKLDFLINMTYSSTQMDDKILNQESLEYDFFISHASEDKNDFVRDLAEALVRSDFKVWYDEFELKVGDSLRKNIDNGLSKSKYGIVIISPNFVKKNWPEYELNGMVAREMNGHKVILPIWHKITKDEVLKFSPTLADKLALNSSIHTIKDIVINLKSLM